MFPDISQVDPNSGYLCQWTYWRPNPKRPNPQMPGEKQMLITYLPAEIDSACRCGSGKLYGDCCRLKPHWHPLCPEPDRHSFGLAHPQSAVFHKIDRLALRERLLADERLYCTVDEPDGGFWVYWGKPVLENEHGILCFGEIEIKRQPDLVVTAMTDLRMRTLLDLLQEAAGDLLSPPRLQFLPAAVIDKRSGKTVKLPDPRMKKARRR